MLAIQDGHLLESEQARIPITDGGLIHGDGVFEVIRVYDGRPFALGEHLDRMNLSAKNLLLAFDVEQMRADISTLLQAAQPKDAIIRAISTSGRCRIAMLEPLKVFPDSLAMITIEYAPPLILDGVKSLSYAANMHATRLAKERGGDEALLVTPEGHVLEAPTSSFFYAFDDSGLITPPLSEHILDSITRRHMIAATGATERVLNADELNAVVEGFVASTLREAIPIHAIDDRTLATPGPLTTDAMQAIRERIMALL